MVRVIEGGFPVKRNLLLALAIATAIGGLAGCAPMMRTGEGVIRAMTPENAGIFTAAGNIAADVHKKVRGDVLGDTTVIDNDPAAKKKEDQKQ